MHTAAPPLAKSTARRAHGLFLALADAMMRVPIVSTRQMNTMLNRAHGCAALLGTVLSVWLSSSAALSADEIEKLGEPRRHVVSKVRPIELIAAEAAVARSF